MCAIGSQNAKTNDLADALRHVLADVFAVTALAYLSKWNIQQTAPPEVLEHVAHVHKAAQRGQTVIARQLWALGRPVSLHSSDPAHVPRWMLAGQSVDPVSELLLLTSGLTEVSASISAAIEVARDVPAPQAMAVLRRLLRNQTRWVRILREDAESLLQADGAKGTLH
ncbi:MAG: hypothetical protein AAFO80_06565 [Pseudomonadota bacterium]